MLGLNEDDVRSTTVLDQRPSWARAIMQQETMPAAAREGVWSGESALLTPDGSEIPVSQVTLAHRSPSGEVEFFSTVARDAGGVGPNYSVRREVDDRARTSEAYNDSSVKEAAPLLAYLRRSQGAAAARCSTQSWRHHPRRRADLVLLPGQGRQDRQAGTARAYVALTAGASSASERCGRAACILHVSAAPRQRTWAQRPGSYCKPATDLSADG